MGTEETKSEAPDDVDVDAGVDNDADRAKPDSIPIPESLPAPNWRKDIRSILLLLLLYILQGIPLGLIVTVPFLLQAKGVPYKEQARFSLAFWPFSFKVVYAPIVDAIYWRRLGRRKSWLIPLQYLISLFLLILVFTVDDLLDSVNVGALTAMFFILNFLAASQDVAVDGWALTMLSPENVSYASTCNAVGQTLGFVLGYSGFMALDSPKFANKFRTVPVHDRGLVTLPQFLLFWSIIFALTTTLILFFKRERKESAEVDAKHMNVFASYRSLWRVLRLRNMQILAAFMLTVRIGMAATDALPRLKLVEAGIPKEMLAFFSIPLIPVKLLLPIIVSKWTVGPNPMRLYINLIPFTYVFGVIFPLVIFWLPSLRDAGTGEYPTWVFFVLFGIMALELVPSYCRFVLYMGFAAKVADPAIGGTYMTLINTITNIGGTWPSTLALWLVDYVAIPLRSDCPSQTSPPGVAGTFNISSFNDDYDFGEDFTNEMTPTSTEGFGSGLASAAAAGFSRCISKIDGYYVESAFCLLIGILWLICWGRPTILRLQALPRHTWKVVKPTT